MLPAIARILELNYNELLDGNEYIIKRKRKRLFILKINNFYRLCLFACCSYFKYGYTTR